jgi:ABC-type ATPase with predicted acetyltransferase domain
MEPHLEFDHEHDLPLPTTPRGHEVARIFGIRFDAYPGPRTPRRAVLPVPSPGQILFIGGPSGSGKSSLLRLVVRRARKTRHVVHLRRVSVAPRPLLELFDDEPLDVTLRRLCDVGLAEIWTWLRPPSELSEGQRWRLRLALALAHAERAAKPVLLVCDEFGAVLDRVSARIVSACMRRAVDRAPIAAILATSHDDLTDLLAPELRIRCDFGRFVLSTPGRTAR